MVVVVAFVAKSRRKESVELMRAEEEEEEEFRLEFIFEMNAAFLVSFSNQQPKLVSEMVNKKNVYFLDFAF